MNLTISRKLGLTALKIKNKKPEIVLAASLIGIGSAFVMAIKEARQLDDILIEAERKMDEISEENEVTEIVEAETKKIKMETTFDVVKLFTPSVATLVVSMAGLGYNQKLNHDKFNELTKAYIAVSESFRQYQKRVIDKYGIDDERSIRYGYQDLEKKKETIVDSDGKKEKQDVIVTQASKGDLDPYSKFFDSASRNWKDDPEMNLNFLLRTLECAQRKFEYQGYLVLNDVLDMLDIPKTAAGHIAGWVWDPEGDNKIDFGIYDINDEPGRRFVNGYEAVKLLHFNCLPNIINKVNNWEGWR